MRRVFLDTSGLVAASTRTDRNHWQAALELGRLKNAGVRFVMHDGIRVERLDALSGLVARAGAMRLLESVSAAEVAGEMEVFPLERRLIERGAACSGRAWTESGA